MALYHLSAKPLSRSKRNTVRAVAYRAGCCLQDIQTNEAFNYRNKLVQYVELVLPENSPAWAKALAEEISEHREEGVQVFCDLAEGAEKRCDARLYSEIEFALPQELDDDQGIQLARDFIKRHMSSKGIGVLACFHLECDEKTGERKPHCHALLLTRRLTESGLDVSKERAWNHVSFLTQVRAAWAEEVNTALMLHGHEARVDHRSYADQGLEIEPQPKLGRNVSELAKRLERSRERAETVFSGPATVYRKATFEAVRLRNLYRILARPELVFEITSRHQATFMWGDVQRVLARYIDDGALFQRMEGRLKASKELVLLRLEEKLGADHVVYTTKTLLKAESRIVATVEHLMADNTHVSGMGEKALKQLSTAAALSSEQEVFVRHLVSPGRLKCGTGFAGTGKTRALSVCREFVESQGSRVYGLSPTGKAAQNLEQSGIPSMTVDRFLHQFQQNRLQYTASSVLILDEAGMVDVRRFDGLLAAVQRLGVKLLCIGDEGQLKPIEAGSAFRLIRERVGEATLSHIQRQRIDWQRTATQRFGELRTEEALNLYTWRKAACILFRKKLDWRRDVVARQPVRHSSKSGSVLSWRTGGLSRRP